MPDAPAPESGFRRYTVVRKVWESEIITSFYLAPVDGAPVAPFVPGQFLTFRFDIAGVPTPTTRTYSVSCSPAKSAEYRITVKREPAPAARQDLPSGLASGFLHDRIEVGATLEAMDPKGHFVLDTESTRPVVLLSGGVGLTPLVSMAHALAKQATRATWFIHACENGRVHALGDEVRLLARQAPNIRTHFCYREPAADDVAGEDFDSAGLVTRDLLQRLLPLDDYELYLCGPTAFMQAQFDTLIGLGICEDRISYEFFGPATVLRRSGEQPTTAKPAVPPRLDAVAEPPEAPVVTFAETGLAVPWNPSCGNLLEFAESQGLSPAFSCRAGICSTCKSGLLAGEVGYVEEPLEMPEEGSALICCSRPKTDVTLAL